MERETDAEWNREERLNGGQKPGGCECCNRLLYRYLTVFSN
jgi:hypothetical protein